MKIIIFSILFTVQGNIKSIYLTIRKKRTNMYLSYSAQYIDDDLITNENSSVTNDLSLITRMRNENDRTSFLNTASEFNIDQENFSTIIPRSDGTYESQTGSYSSIDDLDLTTVPDETNIVIEEQWFNVNQSNRREPFKSILFWKRTYGNRFLTFFCISLCKLNRSFMERCNLYSKI